MSDQTVADSALVTEPVDQAMDFKMCKIGDVTHLTLMADASEASVFMRAFGTKDPNFFHGLLHQVGNAGSKGQYPDEPGIKFMLAFIKGTKPRDEIEAMLIAQMAASHVATMRFANRLAHAESVQEQDSTERAFNKLARTFAAQVEALQRYRVASEEKVVVQHVSVSDGGQAIVGNVTQSQREAAAPDNATPSPPLLVDAKVVPMPKIKKNMERVPFPMSRARREKSRTFEKK
jgi:hypothetical protein